MSKPRDPKAAILATYAKLAGSHRVHPTTSAMTQAGVTRNMIRHHFGSWTQLHAAAAVAHPGVFELLNDTDLYSRRRFDDLKADIKGCRRFVVTTAVTGCQAHTGFLAALRWYCKVHKAKLLVLTATDPASQHNDRPPLDEALEGEHIVTSDLAINKNLHLSSIKLSAKQLDPITGLGRIGQRDGSFIYASPKQRLKLVATSNTALPVALMTTGAVTLPDYDPNRDWAHAYMSKRTAFIAEHDHVLGAIIVEVDGSRFHYRQVQADKFGRFADLGRMYRAGSDVEYAPEALVLGDLHDGETDPVVMEAMVYGKRSLTKTTKPRVIVLHDAFDGNSINHHEQRNATIRARLAAQQRLCLEDEVAHLAATISRLAQHFDEVVVTKSNHDEFLDRYLSDCGYRNDPQNTAYGCELHAAVIRGADPLAHAVGRLLGDEVRGRVRFLRADEDYKVGEVELGAHGHRGANGSRGSLRAMEAAYGNSVSGHKHDPEILRGARSVGTSSKLKLRYNSGPSSWLNCSGLVYPNGSVQLVNVIDGAWRLVA